MITRTRHYESRLSCFADIDWAESNGWAVRQIIISDHDQRSFDAVVVYEQLQDQPGPDDKKLSQDRPVTRRRETP